MILAKVNGKELPGKPTVKWFKGKWQELSSKSGARFAFKESHDSDSNVRPPPPRGTRGRGWHLLEAEARLEQCRGHSHVFLTPLEALGVKILQVGGRAVPESSALGPGGDLGTVSQSAMPLAPRCTPWNSTLGKWS